MQNPLLALFSARRSGDAPRDLAYRADIDGLRAIAVMLVVLNHAGVPILPGGFVGVDVFFVISGFLITGLIDAQAAGGRFTYRSFYLRRAKRLAPALFAMILATLAIGYWLLVPSDYELLATSGVWSAFGAANLFFWLHTGGYFSPDAASFPLLHVWSLSLEEQFYLLWPAVLLMVLRPRTPGLRIGLVAAAVAISVAYDQHGVMVHSKGSYFLPIGRSGEFLLGALTHLLSKPRLANPRIANLLSGLGLLLVMAAALVLNGRSPFPGVLALVPCVGAALILAAPQFGPSLGSRLLATRPFVFVGLISYSVYLWHWPIVSFLRISRVALTPGVTAGIVAASLVLGWLSWAILERGFRGFLDRGGRPALAGAALGGAALLSALATVAVGHGLPQRFPFAMLTQDQLTAERNRYWIALPSKNTTLVRGAGGKQLLIVGDSHAYDLAYALNENGYPGRIKLIESFHECFNFGHQPISPADAPLCAQRLQAVLTSPDLRAADAVYLHDHWGGYDEAGLADMITRLRTVTSVPIYVFGPKMVFTDDVLAISKEAQNRHYATASDINAFASQFQRRELVALDHRLAAYFLARGLPGVRYISTLETQCGAQLACDLLTPGGQYLYFDAGHFTLEGSRRFGARLRRLQPELF